MSLLRTLSFAVVIVTVVETRYISISKIRRRNYTMFLYVKWMVMCFNWMRLISRVRLM